MDGLRGDGHGRSQTRGVHGQNGGPGGAGDVHLGDHQAGRGDRLRKRDDGADRDGRAGCVLVHLHGEGQPLLPTTGVDVNE